MDIHTPDELKPLLPSAHGDVDLISEPSADRNTGCDFLGVEQRTNVGKVVHENTQGCAINRNHLEPVKMDDSPTMDDLRTSTIRRSVARNRANDNMWKQPTRTDTKAFKAAAIQKHRYEVHGTFIQEFVEPEIELRYQDWFDEEYSHGVAATFAASVIWFAFAVNWVVTFHDEVPILWKVLVVHLSLSVWQFADFIMLKVLNWKPCYVMGRWQNYILIYTIFFELFVAMEFILIADFTIENSGEHQGHDTPEIHNPWTITVLFTVFLGFKAGFFHMKIRYFLVSTVVDMATFWGSYAAMAHLIHYKAVFAQNLVVTSVLVTGFIHAWSNNKSSMRLFENFDKSKALLQTLSKETKVLATAKKRDQENREKKQVMISYKHTDTPFALKVKEAMIEAGYKVWIDIGNQQDELDEAKKAKILTKYMLPTDSSLSCFFFWKQNWKDERRVALTMSGIKAGRDWRAEIGEAISNSQAVLFLLSPLAVASKYCKEELYYASSLKVPIFPLMHKNAFNDLNGGAKLILQRIQWEDFENKGFDEAMNHFLPKLSSYLESVQSKYSQLEDNIANGLITNEGIEDVHLEGNDDSMARTAITEANIDMLPRSLREQELQRMGEEEKGMQEDAVADKADEFYDIFICMHAYDSKVGRALHEEFSDRMLNVAPIVDDKLMQGKSNFRDTAYNELERSGCLVFVQTKNSLAKHGYCAEMIHCAYEANCPILVLRLPGTSTAEQRQMSHSLRMMLQMSPKVDFETDNTGAEDKETDKDSGDQDVAKSKNQAENADDTNKSDVAKDDDKIRIAKATMERLTFEVMHIKYAAIKEAEMEEFDPAASFGEVSI
jgi:hypothetical protein